MRETSPPTPEFSRAFQVDKLRDKPMRERIEASEAERAALSRRLNLVALKNLEAELSLQRVRSGEMVEVSGRFAAKVVQNCVVTLENFESSVSEEFKAYFGRSGTPQGEEGLPLEDEHAPEPISPGGEIDLGELAAQHLSLALDPHPRKPGAEFNPPAGGEDQGKRSPFAVLADFKAKRAPKK